MRKFVSDMKVRGFSDETVRTYTLQCSKFLSSCNVADVMKLTEKEFRDHLERMVDGGSLQATSINLYNSVVRFFYEVTLEKDINHKRVPHMKEPVQRPDVLTPDELAAFFSAMCNPKHFAAFLNMYGSGLRISELLGLKIEDIESKRMLIHVRNGKGGKERFTPLTQSGLEALRYYWKTYRPTNRNGYLFPDASRTRPMSARAFEASFKTYKDESGIVKDARPHTLRHCFATHMLQGGTDLMTLKEMLGHSSLSTTAEYLHLSLVDKSNTESPETHSRAFWDEYRRRNFIHA
jgi:site-specific recombinase XerD